MLTGKICYLEIPTNDVETSANFYTKIFGWKIRVRGDGQRAFDDATGGVSGTWVLGRPPMRDPGMIVYISVENVDTALDQVSKTGGQVITPRTSLGPGQAFATFRDPMGNVIGLYQEP
jgi:predicted enzyme related to lactoylglutathione lyase